MIALKNTVVHEPGLKVQYIDNIPDNEDNKDNIDNTDNIPAVNYLWWSFLLIVITAATYYRNVSKTVFCIFKSNLMLIYCFLFLLS